MGSPGSGTNTWQRFDALEQVWCLRINRSSHCVPVRRFFVLVSRLGDGIFWYVLMLGLLASSAHGAMVATQMAAAGLAGVVVYRHLKLRLVRERPFVAHAAISLGTAPLDRYSFPSGHTLHAVCFSSIVVQQVPQLAPVLVPFAALVAASRVVLGLHYPTDVVAGALLGGALAQATLLAWPA